MKNIKFLNFVRYFICIINWLVWFLYPITFIRNKIINSVFFKWLETKNLLIKFIFIILYFIFINFFFLALGLNKEMSIEFFLLKVFFASLIFLIFICLPYEKKLKLKQQNIDLEIYNKLVEELNIFLNTSNIFYKYTDLLFILLGVFSLIFFIFKLYTHYFFCFFYGSYTIFVFLVFFFTKYLIYNYKKNILVKRAMFLIYKKKYEHFIKKK
jgi:hypothetical protein